MRVLVTGGAGRVGKAVVDWLVQRGYSIKVVDRQADVKVPNVEYVEADILDYPRLRELIRGCEAAVHLVAIPSPGVASNEILFNINVTGTYNLFQAAAEEGIRRVVQASSINAIGYYYGIRDWRLSYLPIDEDHPSFTTDPYSLSKIMIEEIGRYFWRRERISSLALRFPAVLPAQAHSDGWVASRREIMRGFIDQLLAMPAERRRIWFEDKRQAYDELRARHAFEDPQLRDQMWRPDSPIPVELRVAFGGRYNFFAMVDERDAAQAVEKGLVASYEGSHPLFISDHAQWTGQDSATLARLLYPEVNFFKKTFTGNEALVSIERARQTIGFDPHYTFG